SRRGRWKSYRRPGKHDLGVGAFEREIRFAGQDARRGLKFERARGKARRRTGVDRSWKGPSPAVAAFAHEGDRTVPVMSGPQDVSAKRVIDGIGVGPPVWRDGSLKTVGQVQG